MADNYTRATVEPFLPEAVCTEERLEVLSVAGFESEMLHSGLRYFFAKDGVNEYDTDDKPTGYVEVFQQMLKEANVEELYIVGAFLCSKMRPGEFGGFVIRITPDTIQTANTYTLQKLMQMGEL
jgi:hypothetical protein